jgi:tetratricopeptide (TPR) repeat protein
VVIDPNSQTTVYAESADGVGAVSALDSIDSVTHELRAKLGEALKAIENDSEPLPKVTSANLQALRAYALADNAYADGETAAARRLFDEALRLDPDFALALIGLARVDYRDDRFEAAADKVRRALQLRDRLTTRDELYVDAWSASFGPAEPALEKWALLTAMYPDFHDARYNLALYQWLWVSRAKECVATISPADVGQYASRDDAVYLKATCLLGMNKVEEALTEFSRASALGVKGAGFAHASAFAANRDHVAAWARLSEARENLSSSTPRDFASMAAAFQLDQGKVAEAMLPLQAEIENLPAEQLGNAIVLTTQRSLVSAIDGWQGTEERQLHDAVRHLVASLPADSVAERQPARFALAVLGLVAARHASWTIAHEALAAADDETRLAGFPLHRAIVDCLRAEILAGNGDLAGAFKIVAQFEDPPLLLQQTETRIRVLLTARDYQAAADHAVALEGSRGRAFAEWGLREILRPLNVASVAMASLYLAEAQVGLGDEALGRASLDRFREHWPEVSAQPEMADRITQIFPE